MFSLQPLLVVWTRWLCTLELVRLEQARGSRVEITIPRSKVVSTPRPWLIFLHPSFHLLGVFENWYIPKVQLSSQTEPLVDCQTQSQTCFLIDIKFRGLTSHDFAVFRVMLWVWMGDWPNQKPKVGINDFCDKHNSLCIKQWEQTCKHNEKENKKNKGTYQIYSIIQCQ